MLSSEAEKLLADIAKDEQQMLYVPGYPDAVAEELIGAGKIKFAFATTGGINPSAGYPKPGAYYKLVE